MKPRPVYLLPPRWSLHYIMPAKEWSFFRDRVKHWNPGWRICSCPERRAATQLHEEWSCDDNDHLKRLIRVVFLCARCHGPTNEGWLPVYLLRLDDYLDNRVNLEEEPYFGSTPEQHINAKARMASITAICKNNKLSPRSVFYRRKVRIARFLNGTARLRRSLKAAREGRTKLVPYGIDLSALKQYGCDTDYVRELERLADSQAKHGVQMLLRRMRFAGLSILLYQRDRPQDRRTWGRVAFSLPGTGLYIP